MKRLSLLIILLLASVSVGYAENPSLMMATTTSTENTGLLDYLAPHFEKAAGITLKWVAVGTGKALEYGKNCDVDVLLVHAPETEKEFVAQGHGIDRKEVMYNDFIIIGPESDPAGIKNLGVQKALTTIKASRTNFISRGDQSGTHKMELSLWKEAGIPAPDKEPWYIQTGQDMLTTINMAAEKNGYTLTDRGTYIKYENTMNGAPPLKILVENDARLLNQYSVILVNPENCPRVKSGPAKQFSDWITGKEAQTLIGAYMFQGKALFVPNAGK